MLKGEVIPISAEYPREAADLPDALEHHLDSLYRFALRLSRNTDDASELVQESALRAWERRDTNIENWRAWLFQTLYHAFISRKRRSKRWGEDDSVDPELAEVASVLDPLAALVAVEDVRRAMDLLPENLRIVVWLADAESFRLREIAVILDCPVGTVASRLARARDALRMQLAAYGPRKLRES